MAKTVLNIARKYPQQIGKFQPSRRKRTNIEKRERVKEWGMVRER